MAARKHLDAVERLFAKSPVVDYASIERIIGKKNGYAKLLVHNLLHAGKISRVARGWYTSHRDPALAVFCFKPAYLGLHSALTHHRVWDQASVPVILTAKTVRRGTRSALGANIIVRHLDREYGFGIEYASEGQFYVPYSDLEKTFIDFVVYKEPLPPDAASRTARRIDRTTLGRYLKRYPSLIRRRVLQGLNLAGGKTTPRSASR